MYRNSRARISVINVAWALTRLHRRAHAFICTQRDTFTPDLRLCTYIHTSVHTHTKTVTHMCTHTHTHMHTCSQRESVRVSQETRQQEKQPPCKPAQAIQQQQRAASGIQQHSETAKRRSGSAWLRLGNTGCHRSCSYVPAVQITQEQAGKECRCDTQVLRGSVRQHRMWRVGS